MEIVENKKKKRLSENEVTARERTVRRVSVDRKRRQRPQRRSYDGMRVLKKVLCSSVVDRLVTIGRACSMIFFHLDRHVVEQTNKNFDVFKLNAQRVCDEMCRT